MRALRAEGRIAVTGGTLLWAASAIAASEAFRASPGSSSLSGSWIRVFVNLLVVLGLHRLTAKRRGAPWGSGEWDLWVWGLLGALTITSYFAAIRLLGAGEAALLQATQGLVVAAASGFFLGRKTDRWSWLAVLGGMAGLCLVLTPEGGQARSPLGLAAGLASGIAAGCAYLVLSRSRAKHDPLTIGFYWSLVSLAIVTVLCIFSGARFPHQSVALLALVASALFGALAQWLTTVAYRSAPAALVSASFYAVPVLGLGWDAMLRDRPVSAPFVVGCGLVLGCGAIVPLWRVRG